MKISIALLVTIVLLLLCPLQLAATEELADKTGKKCQYCHLDPAGGGELSALGDGYLLALQAPVVAGEVKKPEDATKPFNRIFKFIIGYLHILTGVFWFGTILYVHLILKPAYASKGLPKGEVKLGLVSIVIMAITGIILTLYRVPSLEFFIATRFGFLLLLKISLFLVMAISAFFVVFFIGPRLKKSIAVTKPTGDQMTEEELSFFDGRDGRPAYFAYHGKIYDATLSKLWKNGNHMARHSAGIDLTPVLSQAPHGEDKVFDMPMVAKLVATTSRSGGFDHKKVFFYMAYMNLINVFLIILIMALWKWW